jgi:hypothetical protein
MRPEIPASCQSCKRLQHVIPESHPSSCGSISHGIPLRRTNRMPVRQARFCKRGLPPFGLCGIGGNIGWIESTKRREAKECSWIRIQHLTSMCAEASWWIANEVLL